MSRVIATTVLALGLAASAVARSALQDPAEPATAEAVAIEAAVVEVEVQGDAPAPKDEPAVKIEVRVADEDDDKLDAEAAQYVNNFLPMLRSELHLLRTTCDLDDGRVEAIAAQGRRAVNRAAKQFVKQMRQPQPIGQSDPFGQLIEQLDRVAKESLTPERYELYREEVAAREQDVKRAAILNLVASYDEDLYLTAEQRAKIGDSLSEGWKPEWCRSLEIFHYDKQFLPKVPDSHVVEHLTDEQKAIWSELQKNRSTIYGFVGGDRFGDNAALEPIDLSDPNQPAPPGVEVEAEGRGLMRAVRRIFVR